MMELPLFLQMLPFRTPRYRALNKSRLQHLDSLHLPLSGRTVLDVGAAIGDHANFYRSKEYREAV